MLPPDTAERPGAGSLHGRDLLGRVRDRADSAADAGAEGLAAKGDSPQRDRTLPRTSE